MDRLENSGSLQKHPQSKHWKRYLLIAGMVLLLPLLCLATLVAYNRIIMAAELRDAIAEIDAVDPGWRLHELEARRPQIAEEQNAALVVLAVTKKLPAVWLSEQFEETLRDLDPVVLLTDQEAGMLRAELEKLGPLLVEARQLANLPTGRYPIIYNREPFSTLLPHVQPARALARLLGFDAMLRAQEKDVEGAITSWRAMLNAGRSLGDEPITVSQLVRNACRDLALANLERSLAQGEVAEATLVALQRLLDDEEAQPLLLIMAQGNRAALHGFLEAVEAGEASITQFYAGQPHPALRRMLDGYLREGIKREHARALQDMTDAVAITLLPVEEQWPELQAWQAMVRATYRFLIFPDMSKAARSIVRTQALLRCACVALALERYRLAHGHWPEALAELLPEQLEAVPIDPFDGALLRFRRLDDGVLVYSVGPDGEDNAGTLDRQKPVTLRKDVGFSLWDVTKRRQPPKSPALPAEREVP